MRVGADILSGYPHHSVKWYLPVDWGLCLGKVQMTTSLQVTGRAPYQIGAHCV
jgi:hypothetical protein